MGGLLHDLRARIIVFVDAVTKAHQAERIILVFCAANIFRDLVNGTDFGEHFQRGLVGAAMGRAPKAGNTSSNTGKRIGAG